MSETRKLTTILAADVAGYSRLAAADEKGMLARLKAHRRKLIDPKSRNIAVASQNHQQRQADVLNRPDLLRELGQ